MGDNLYKDLLKAKKLRPDRLIPFGFIKAGDRYEYRTSVMNGEFDLTVQIDDFGDIDTTLIESENGEEYVLYKTGASGTFVGSVRLAIEETLNIIIASCYVNAVFKTRQAEMLTEYVRGRYGDELEFLWEKFPDNAVWRRKDNEKWYAALLTVERYKLGGSDSRKKTEIIDLRADKAEIPELLQQGHIYPGWHMNKKSWYTIILDDGVPDEELIQRLDESYRLAKKA